MRGKLGQSRIERRQELLASADISSAKAPGFLDIGWHYQGAIPSLAAGLHQETRLAA
jgi:hypothetical protein